MASNNGKEEDRLVRDNEQIPFKDCAGCGQVYPLSRLYWHADSNTDTGFHSHCKSCRLGKKAKEQIDLAEQALAEKVKEAQATSLAILDVMQVPKNYSRVPHMAELYERMIEVFGGPQGIAQHYLLTFLAAKPGSSIRQKIMQSMMNLSVMVSQDGKARVPLELMSEEDVDRAIEEKAKQVLKIAVVDEQSA